jgi:hypothetical protein
MFRSSQNLEPLVRQASSRNLVSWMMAMLMQMLFSGYFSVSLKSLATLMHKPAFILPASFSYMVSKFHGTHLHVQKSGGKQIMSIDMYLRSNVV